MKKMVQFFTLVLLMLTAGVFWGTWFTLTRSIHDFSAAEFIHIGKVIIDNVADPMKVIMPGGILFLIIAAGLAYSNKEKGFCLMIASLLLMISTLLITLLVEVPIDNQIKTWTVSTVPGDWSAIRERWAYFHAARTFTSLGGYVIFCASLFMPRPSGS